MYKGKNRKSGKINPLQMASKNRKTSAPSKTPSPYKRFNKTKSDKGSIASRYAVAERYPDSPGTYRDKQNRSIGKKESIFVNVVLVVVGRNGRISVSRAVFLCGSNVFRRMRGGPAEPCRRAR
jgi:hypothetical protein